MRHADIFRSETFLSDCYVRHPVADKGQDIVHAEYYKVFRPLCLDLLGVFIAFIIFFSGVLLNPQSICYQRRGGGPIPQSPSTIFILKKETSGSCYNSACFNRGNA